VSALKPAILIIDKGTVNERFLFFADHNDAADTLEAFWGRAYMSVVEVYPPGQRPEFSERQTGLFGDEDGEE